jgi:hypothetical protein
VSFSVSSFVLRIGDSSYIVGSRAGKRCTHSQFRHKRDSYANKANPKIEKKTCRQGISKQQHYVFLFLLACRVVLVCWLAFCCARLLSLAACKQAIASNQTNTRKRTRWQHQAATREQAQQISHKRDSDANKAKAKTEKEARKPKSGRQQPLRVPLHCLLSVASRTKQTSKDKKTPSETHCGGMKG